MFRKSIALFLVIQISLTSISVAASPLETRLKGDVKLESSSGQVAAIPVVAAAIRGLWFLWKLAKRWAKRKAINYFIELTISTVVDLLDGYLFEAESDLQNTSVTDNDRQMYAEMKKFNELIDAGDYDGARSVALNFKAKQSSLESNDEVDFRPQTKSALPARDKTPRMVVFDKSGKILVILYKPEDEDDFYNEVGFDKYTVEIFAERNGTRNALLRPKNEPRYLPTQPRRKYIKSRRRSNGGGKWLLTIGATALLAGGAYFLITQRQTGEGGDGGEDLSPGLPRPPQLPGD